jgi:hypothetical protein
MTHLLRAESFDEIDVLGPTVEILAPAGLPDDAPCAIRGTIPSGGVIPLHSHGDPETFLALAGEMEGLVSRGGDPVWECVRPGDVLHVPGNSKHAWRNRSSAPAQSLIITTGRMARFFRELGRALDNGSSLVAVAERYGHWNATPEENARLGILTGA